MEKVKNMLFGGAIPDTFIRIGFPLLGILMLAASANFYRGDFNITQPLGIAVGLLLLMSPIILPGLQAMNAPTEMMGQTQFITTANTLYQDNIDQHTINERLEWQVMTDEKEIESLKAEVKILTEKKKATTTTPWYVSIGWVIYGTICGFLLKGAIDKQRAVKAEIDNGTKEAKPA